MIIGIAGKAGSGKDTAADYLVREHGFLKISWAGPLKAGMAAMGFPEPANREDKENLIPGFYFTWREAAQRLGTEWGRAMDPDIWVKVLMTKLAEHPELNYVISDCRFENEAAAIRAAGGSIIHLRGREADLGENAGHASEQGLQTYVDDWQLNNSKSLRSLYDTLRHLVGVEMERRA